MTEHDKKTLQFTKFMRESLNRMSPEEIKETNVKDFLSIVQPLWKSVSKVPFVLKLPHLLFRNVLNICVNGWNAAILFKTEKEVFRFLEHEYGKNSLDNMVATNACRQKRALYPCDLLIIEDVKVQYNKGNPIYDFTFDVSALEDFIQRKK